MHALVTGGGGFLGRHIAERLLRNGHRVTILARGDYPALKQLGATQIRGDIRDREQVSAACKGTDVVFHAASKIGSWGDAKSFDDTNINGTQNVIDACLQNGVRRLIYTSTPSVVFSTGDICHGNETLPYPRKHLSHYQRSKAEAERRVLSANGHCDLVTTALRPHAIWGVGDNYLVPRLMAAAMQNKLKIIGDGRNKISMVHVRNAAAAHVLAAQSTHVAGKAYFINDPEPVVLWDWINRVFARLNLPVAKKRIPYPVAYGLGYAMESLYRALPLSGEPRVTRYVASLLARHHYFDISNAVRDLGSFYETTHEQGTNELVQHYRTSLKPA